MAGAVNVSVMPRPGRIVCGTAVKARQGVPNWHVLAGFVCYFFKNSVGVIARIVEPEKSLIFLVRM